MGGLSIHVFHELQPPEKKKDAQGEFERYPALLATELSVVAAGGMYTFSLALPAHTAHQHVYIYIYVYTSSITHHHISSCIIIYHHISLHIHQIWTDIFRKCCLNSSSRQFLWTKHHTSSSENDADRLGARSLQVSVMPKSTGWLSEIQEMNNSLRWGMTDGPRF